MPLIAIIDDYNNNNVKGFIRNLITLSLKSKELSFHALTRNIRFIDTRSIYEPSSLNAEELYQTNNAVFLLMGSKASRIKEKISDHSRIIICPNINNIISTPIADSIHRMNYFTRAQILLNSKFDEKLF